MKIKLTQGKYAIVGQRDYAYLNQFKWHYHKNRGAKTGYAVRNIGNWPNQRIIRMHRVILERQGYKDFAKSDHINGDGLDNRRSNLRPATNHQSQCNRGMQCNNTSGYIGVSKHGKKWRAYIMVNKKQIHLGVFDDIEDAARAYAEAALKYHKEFVRTA